MATVGHKFKRGLLKYDSQSQLEILSNAKEAASGKPEETSFYNWIQQMYFARMNTRNDREFMDNILWGEMNNHRNSNLFREITNTL